MSGPVSKDENMGAAGLHPAALPARGAVNDGLSGPNEPQNVDTLIRQMIAGDTAQAKPEVASGQSRLGFGTKRTTNETPATSSAASPRAETAVQALLEQETLGRGGGAVQKTPPRALRFFGRFLGRLLRRVYPAALIQRIRAYRPTPKHIFWAALALIMVMRPWLIPLVLLVAFWVVLIGYLTLGPDRVTELVSAGWHWLRARRPELAETLRQRAEKMALRIDAFLDRLPDNWTEGLYLPDLSKSALAQGEGGDRPDPFDRIAAETRRG